MTRPDTSTRSSHGERGSHGESGTPVSVTLARLREAAAAHDQDLPAPAIPRTPRGPEPDGD